MIRARAAWSSALAPVARADGVHFSRPVALVSARAARRDAWRDATSSPGLIFFARQGMARAFQGSDGNRRIRRPWHGLERIVHGIRGAGPVAGGFCAGSTDPQRMETISAIQEKFGTRSWSGRHRDGLMLVGCERWSFGARRFHLWFTPVTSTRFNGCSRAGIFCGEFSSCLRISVQFSSSPA
ncbi:hypothetical protein SBC1_57910 (plasmid) [Caballeronia sp. SBC1]|nr:hypothetical protein SBC2_57540 [Caballeronia sp. SBC2]QIN65745.1 hypothetical protein SBC1_57910 [Caballeronia sp. SBC1]